MIPPSLNTVSHGLHLAGQLDRQVQRLIDDFALTPVTASEIEFYLYGSEQYAGMTAFWHDIRHYCAQAHIDIFNIEKERGHEQHEIALTPIHPAACAANTTLLKQIVTDTAEAHTLKADFTAKPLADQPGSGLHIHIHLTNSEGRNVFYKDNETISDPLKFAIGGLLVWLPDCMPIFAPNANSYARFVPGSNTPLTVSWGANNRTVAIRLPEKPHDNKHIEHRVSGADADTAAVITVLLAAIHDGLTKKLIPGPQIYGDASLPMYQQARFPLTWEEGMRRMAESGVCVIARSASDAAI